MVWGVLGWFGVFPRTAFWVPKRTLVDLNLNLNSLLVKRQIDNPSPGAVSVSSAYILSFPVLY